MKTTLVALSAGLGLLLLWAALRPAAAPQIEPPAPQPLEHLQPSAAGLRAERPGLPPTAAETRGPEPAEQPLSSIRMDYERQPRDAGAAAAEQTIRGIYASDPAAEGILREVRCSETVCKLDARWSRQWNGPYNAALLKIIAAFSRELSLETGGPPDGVSVPIAIYVRRSASASAQR